MKNIKILNFCEHKEKVLTVHKRTDIIQIYSSVTNGIKLEKGEHSHEQTVNDFR